MSNSVDPEPSHLDLRCLHKPVIIVCGSERVKYCGDGNVEKTLFRRCVVDVCRGFR